MLERVTVGTHRLAVRRLGAGPPLLLLHDGGSTADRDFASLMKPLAEKFTVLAPDLRGHGRSDPVDRVFWPGLVRDVAKLLEGTGTPRAHVLGVGDGATIALHLALEEPERVASLVLAGARTHVPEEDLTRLDALHPVNLRDGAPQLAEALSAAHGPGWEHLLDRWLASFRLDRAYLDVRARLHDVTVPTLVLHGVRDPLTPTSHADVLADGLPHARLVLLDAGRRVQDAPDFPRVLAGFLTDHALHAPPDAPVAPVAPAAREADVELTETARETDVELWEAPRADDAAAPAEDGDPEATSGSGEKKKALRQTSLWVNPQG